LKVKEFSNLSEEKKTNPDVRRGAAKKHWDDIYKLLAKGFDRLTSIELSNTMKGG